jgi:hypothetical protein
MKFLVLSITTKEHQIFWPIIVLHLIKVMNHLSGIENSSQDAFHDGVGSFDIFVLVMMRMIGSIDINVSRMVLPESTPPGMMKLAVRKFGP